eukprot:GEMP01040635.1.p1 GENE.GEMP01040635.1~~GEMP01040635.1.p1  ORF type:complete len:240 (+),score=82.95 GEMP01040635.1:94-813(+)
MGNRETSVYLSKVAEQAERYDEMAEYMKKVAEAKEELNAEERNLFSVAYKNAVGSRRASWRIISDVEQKERTLGHKEFYMAAEDFRKRVEEELHQICNEVIALLNDCLIPMANNGESNVFYFKMKGDYFRYLAEFNAGDDHDRATKQACDAYEAAMSIAQAELQVTHPIRLGLALNFSVFYYEVMKNAVDACKMARTAFEDAIAELDSVQEESYKDSTLIMQLLRDNLTLWTSDPNAAA